MPATCGGGSHIKFAVIGMLCRYRGGFSAVVTFKWLQRVVVSVAVVVAAREAAGGGGVASAPREPVLTMGCW
jgi:hypothetical protein